MGAYLVYAVLGIPCLIFLIFSLTPKGKKWLRSH
jgi:hypothetical protein